MLKIMYENLHQIFIVHVLHYFFNCLYVFTLFITYLLICVCECYVQVMDKGSKRTISQQHDTPINDATVDAAVAAALATQQHTIQTIIYSQLKTFQARLQACIDATNNRIDTFVRETITDITELKASLHNTQKEVNILVWIHY